MNSIILGIWDNPEFYSISIKTDSEKYPFFSLIDWNNYKERGGIISTVILACEKADRIHFVLDYIKPGWSGESFTSEELYFVLGDKKSLDKTTFWKDGNIIDREWVIETYSKELLNV